jgi:hypothetical protein
MCLLKAIGLFFLLLELLHLGVDAALLVEVEG